MSDFKSRVRDFIFRKNPRSEPELAEQGRVFLIIGLGNPGREYRDTRHNVGFMVVDRLAEDLGISLARVQHRAITGAGKIGENRVILAKPQTYMNLSGESVSGLARFYKVPLNQIMVVHDDLDLPFGTLRIRPGGGSAGQKGMQSIIDRLGSQDFPRLRFGIGRPPGSKHGVNYVLEGFSPLERKELPYLIAKTADAVKVFINEGLDTAMNRYNGNQVEV